MSTEKSKGRFSRRTLLIAAGALIVVCIVCVAITAIFPSNKEPTQVAQEAPSQATSVPEKGALPTDMPVPTDTNIPAPSDTPRPTDTLEPTSTPDPDLVEPGTYLVGTDIQPGLYIGKAGEDFGSSCYWARLSDLTGDLDSIIANDNSVGQFYFEILETDYALNTDCAVHVFHRESIVVDTFPTGIGPGYYLVGLDIQPGTYRGEAGADITDSCYWARLSNFAGEMDSILANDNAIGQYFVEVGADDYGLNTGCDLELTN